CLSVAPSQPLIDDHRALSDSVRRSERLAAWRACERETSSFALRSGKRRHTEGNRRRVLSPLEVAAVHAPHAQSDSVLDDPRAWSGARLVGHGKPRRVETGSSASPIVTRTTCAVQRSKAGGGRGKDARWALNNAAMP